MNATVTDGHWKGCTALHLAAQAGKLETVEVLLEAGANPDTKNYDGWTPLHLASQFGILYIVQALL